MKVSFIIFLFIFSLPIFSQEKLDNDAVIELYSMDFGEEIIIAKINNSPGKYNTSIPALKKLKEGGIPSKVIAAMINNSIEPVKTGIFYKTPTGEVEKIEPLAFSGRRTNHLTAAMTYGIAANNSYAYLRNNSSSNKIKKLDQIFEFYFDETQRSETSNPNYLFMDARSPRDFVLVKLFSNDRKNHRGIKTGEHGSFSGSQTGIDSEDIIEVAVSDEGNGKYRIRSMKPLKPGEYCFIYQGALPVDRNYVARTIYDFSIIPE
ncbi:hypothetical protein [Salegentibacter salegens]|uniref:Uncharacterized protein n=1 Tax=Salegentibacter salegens TaxID=143223 RepID=A0A1M7IYL2_9FLAO|nr:hypothetical protein [Salegentibacter salegens]PRX49861.1 hypothetical protein LY58_00967 [Salegentibacter salegens]SHM45924.1 hypothetical protein SAMN05878281_0744 [Salegentibacter salegens]